MVNGNSKTTILFFAVIVIVAIFYYLRPNGRQGKRNQYSRSNSSLRQADSLSGIEFEHWCKDLLQYNGYTDVQVTKASGDQGADIIAYRNGDRYAIQCKRFKNKCGNSPIQEVYAAKAHYRCTRAAVMTTNYFTDGAIDLARSTGVELWDRSVLSRMVTVKNDYLYRQSGEYQEERSRWQREESQRQYQFSEQINSQGEAGIGSSKAFMTGLQALGVLAVIGVFCATAYFLADNGIQTKLFQSKPGWSSSSSFKSARNSPTSNTALIPSYLVYTGSTQAEYDHFAEEYGLTSVKREEDGSVTMTSETNIMHANVDALVAAMSKKCGESGYIHFVSISVNEDHTAFTIVVNDVNMSKEEKQATTDLLLMAGLEAVQTNHNIDGIRLETKNKLGSTISTQNTGK